MTIKDSAGVFNDLRNIELGLSRVSSIINSSELMSAAVRPIGLAWHENFFRQGSRVGGWKPLSDYTIREREQRGYGSGPILKQEGGLFRHAIDPFSSWGVGTYRYSGVIPPTMARSRVVEDSWRFQGPGADQRMYSYGQTRVVGSVSPRKFFAHIAGPKAQHQTGGAMPFGKESGWVNLPARPFWFFDPQSVNRSLSAVGTVLVMKLVESMPNPVNAWGRGVMSAGAGISSGSVSGAERVTFGRSSRGLVGSMDA